MDESKRDERRVAATPESARPAIRDHALALASTRSATTHPHVAQSNRRAAIRRVSRPGLSLRHGCLVRKPIPRRSHVALPRRRSVIVARQNYVLPGGKNRAGDHGARKEAGGAPSRSMRRGSTITDISRRGLKALARFTSPATWPG